MTTRLYAWLSIAVVCGALTAGCSDGSAGSGSGLDAGEDASSGTEADTTGGDGDGGHSSPAVDDGDGDTMGDDDAAAQDDAGDGDTNAPNDASTNSDASDGNTPPLPSDCGALAHGTDDTRVRCQATTVPAGTSCVCEVQTNRCNDGVFEGWIGSYAFESCVADLPPCGGKPSGAIEVDEFFEHATVPYGGTCVSKMQTRTCNAGTWSAWNGDYEFTECHANPPADCDAQHKHGSERTRVRYLKAQPTAPATCQPETQKSKCENGKWLPFSGSYEFDTCSVCTDQDGDHHGTGCSAGNDCNDQEPTAYVGASEQEGNLIDENCDGKRGRHLVRRGDEARYAYGAVALCGEDVLWGASPSNLEFYSVDDPYTPVASLDGNTPFQRTLCSDGLLLAGFAKPGNLLEVHLYDVRDPQAGLPQLSTFEIGSHTQLYLSRDTKTLYVGNAANYGEQDIQRFDLSDRAHPTLLEPYRGCMPTDDEGDYLLAPDCKGVRNISLYRIAANHDVSEIDTFTNDYGGIARLSKGFVYAYALSRAPVSPSGIGDWEVLPFDTADYDISAHTVNDQGFWYVRAHWTSWPLNLCRVNAAGQSCTPLSTEPISESGWLSTLIGAGDRLVAYSRSAMWLYDTSEPVPALQQAWISTPAWQPVRQGAHTFLLGDEVLFSLDPTGKVEATTLLAGNTFSLAGGLAVLGDTIYASHSTGGSSYLKAFSFNPATGFHERYRESVSPRPDMLVPLSLPGDDLLAGVAWTGGSDKIFSTTVPFDDDSWSWSDPGAVALRIGSVVVADGEDLVVFRNIDYEWEVVVLSYSAQAPHWVEQAVFPVEDYPNGTLAVKDHVLYWAGESAFNALHLGTGEEKSWPPASSLSAASVAVVGDAIVTSGATLALLLDGKLVNTGFPAGGWLYGAGDGRLLVQSTHGYVEYELVDDTAP